MTPREGIFAHWPNRITALRFAGSLILFLIFSLGGRLRLSEPGLVSQVAFWLFIVTALTDILDGYLARRGNLVTAFGRIADPFVDKVLVIGTMVFLASFEWTVRFVPAWIVVVVLAREFLVTGIRGYIESLGLPFPADWLGKVKMLIQCHAIGVVLGMSAWGVHVRFWDAVAHVLVWATLITTLGSGMTYVLRMRRLVAEAAR
jgi:CDP-diacylglycerol--glycerol-3-phosphate 3-phosphatidyltransferase